VTKNISRINDYIPVNDSLNITIINLQEVSGNFSSSEGLNVIVDQWVRIQTRVKGSPLPRVTIIPKSIEINNRTIIRRTFIPGSEIPINFSVRNNGKAKLKNSFLKINTSLPALYGEKLSYEILELGPGNESETFTVRFQAPSKDEIKVFLISAEVKGYDVFGKAYQANDSINIEVNPLTGKKIDIKKYVSEKIYFGEIGVITISMKNNLSRKIENLSLVDTLPSGLTPLDTNLSWNFTLLPNELKSISYQVRPQKPGTYYLPPGSSVIEYKEELYYNLKLVKMIVNGPYVVMIKSASPDDPVKGDNITIRLDIKNIGDSNAVVKLKDRVPINNSLPARGFKWVLDTLVLHPGNSTSYSYTFNATEKGTFNIPQADATILDQFFYQDERYMQIISSNGLTLTVREAAVMPQMTGNITATPKRTAVPKTTQTPGEGTTTPKPVPGFQNNIFVLVFFVILLARKTRILRD
jgi:uncharacterized repeat protein (TIGR01451 family)